MEEVDDGATHAPKAARPILIPVWESPCLLTPFLSAWSSQDLTASTEASVAQENVEARGCNSFRRPQAQVQIKTNLELGLGTVAEAPP